MPDSVRLTLALLLLAAAAWSLRSTPARSARPDPLVTLMTGGLLGLVLFTSTAPG